MEASLFDAGIDRKNPKSLRAIQWTVMVAAVLQPIIAERFGKTANLVIVQALPLPLITLHGFSGSFAVAEARVWTAGWTVGPLLSGWIRSTLGFELGFNVLFVAMLILHGAGIAYAWFVLRPIEKAGRSSDAYPGTAPLE